MNEETTRFVDDDANTVDRPMELLEPVEPADERPDRAEAAARDRVVKD